MLEIVLPGLAIGEIGGLHHPHGVVGIREEGHACGVARVLQQQQTRQRGPHDEQQYPLLGAGRGPRGHCSCPGAAPDGNSAAAVKMG